MPSPIAKYATHDQEPQRVQMWYQNPAVRAGGSWVSIPRLRCESASLAVQPIAGISTLSLSYDYGEIDIGDGNGFVDYPPLGEAGSVIQTLNPYGTEMNVLFHRFVRVQIFNSGTGLWDNVHCGVVTSSEDREFKQPRGPATDNDTVVRRGTQAIVASGPEWVLNRTQVTQSTARNAAGNFTVKRGLTFNAQGRISGEVLGNRDDVFSLFGDEPETTVKWSGQDVANYLNGELFPETLDVDNVANFVSPLFTWLLTNASKLSNFSPQIETHGKTLYSILNELASPRRFLHWHARYVPNASDAVFGTFEVIFDTGSASIIAIPSGDDVPANANTVSLLASGNVGAGISLKADSTGEFSQVIVEGARKGHIVTAEVHAGPLLKQGWSAEDQAAYTEGAKSAYTTPEWTALARAEKEQLNRSLRQNKYPDVFTRFVCPLDADFTGITDNDLFISGLRWSRYIPLKEGWDYSVATPVAKTGARDKPEFRKMFSIYELTSKDATIHPDRYEYGHELALTMKMEGWEGTPASVRIRPLEDVFGVELRPAGNALPHWQASSVAPEDPDKDIKAAFHWQSDIEVTGYFQEDERASAKWPATPDIENKSAAAMTIRLGDIAFYDTLHGNTVVEIDEKGQKVLSPSTDVIVRDDTDTLEAIARLAYEWYGTRRFGYSVTFSHYVRDVRPGVIATNIDGASANAVVTEVVYDFNERSTAIATAYAEPDFTLLAREALNV